MDMTRLRQGDQIAAGAGIALFIIMFLTWFTIDGIPEGAPVSGDLSAWDAFDFIDIILLITVIVAVGAAALRASGNELNLPIPTSTLTAGLGGLSVLLILFRIISTPSWGFGGFGSLDTSVSYGVILGLIAAAGITFGGWTAMQEEGTSFGDVGDSFSGGQSGTGAPPPPPPPSSTPPPPPPPPPSGEPPPPPPPPPPSGGPP